MNGSSKKGPFLSHFSYWLVFSLVFFEILLLIFLYETFPKASPEEFTALLFGVEILLLFLLFSFYLFLPCKGDSLLLLFSLFFSASFLMASQIPDKIQVFLKLNLSLALYGAVFFAFLSLFSFLPQKIRLIFHFCFSQSLLFSPFYFHYFLSLMDDKDLWTTNLLWLHPLPIGLENLFGWDFFRFRWMYDFSTVSDIPYQYPTLYQWNLFLGKLLLLFLTLKLSLFSLTYIIQKVKST
ncbi:MAG: hypothetical protein D6785_05100 [Planctomycetota bacterium]|nr:MAG: hypothetical protein D6785_05100 [Planctomycetota bacterium]